MSMMPSTMQFKSQHVEEISIVSDAMPVGEHMTLTDAEAEDLPSFQHPFTNR